MAVIRYTPTHIDMQPKKIDHAMTAMTLRKANMGRRTEISTRLAPAVRSLDVWPLLFCQPFPAHRYPFAVSLVTCLVLRSF